MALTNEQYDMIMQIYNDRQLRDRHEADRRRDEAFAAVPRLQEIDNEIADAGIQKARHLLGSPDAGDIDLDAMIRDLKEERQALLQIHGWPPDYLEPVYVCPKCHDTGYIGGKKCSCFRKLESELLYRDSHLGDILDRENFGTFRLDLYDDTNADPKTGRTPRDEAKAAFDSCRAFTQHFPSGENLMLYGDVGVGKSFLTHCIARELLEKSFSVLYMASYEISDLLGQYRFQQETSLREAHDNIFSMDLLIIDDLGAEIVNNFVSSQIFQIINERILSGRSTVISTNLSLAGFRESFSERTASRMMGSYKLIHLSGNDLRIQQKLGGNGNG
ncbi:MAG: ATP-binding protein [Bilifractor sp.]|jgi:DNA replication protein DnaC|nr:ATP-binding protein [Lachnospiraceae bacterium]